MILSDYKFYLLRKCSSCNKEKPLSDYHNDKSSKHGKCYRCKVCAKRATKFWRKENPERTKENKKSWKYSNQEYLKEYDRKYRENNREHIREYEKAWRDNNLEKSRKHSRDYIERNKENHYNRVKQWRSKNPEYFKKLQRDYRRKKYRRDKNLRCAVAMRSMLYRTLKSEKTKETHVIMGYAPEDLVKRIECQFQPGMSWENHGEWEIDHKIPIDYFLKKGEERPHVINALSNLQPLWMAENRSKKNRRDET